MCIYSLWNSLKLLLQNHRLQNQQQIHLLSQLLTRMQIKLPALSGTEWKVKFILVQRNGINLYIFDI